ncbi:MAG: M24 family metallopeptidase [Hyphomicrobiaceae bacterium]
MTAADLSPAGTSMRDRFAIPPRPDIDMERLRRYRLGRLREELKAADMAMAVLVNPVSLRYAVDWREYALFQAHIPTYYLFVPAEGPVVMHGTYGGASDVIDEFRSADYLSVFDAGMDLSESARGLADEISVYLRDIGIADARPRIASERMNPSAVMTLLQAGIEVHDGEAIVEKARYRKSEDEIDCMRFAIAVAQHGMATMQDAMVPGMTENALFALLHQINIANDGDWIDGRMLASGPRTNPWYQEASSRAIEQGDLVAFDTDMIGPFGYCADISRTWLCGTEKPTDAQRDVYRRAHEEVHANMDLVRAGMSFRELSEKAFQQPDEFVAHRYACVAHGVGMSDEYPKIYYRQDWDRHGYDGVIEDGSVLCIESFTGSERGGPGVKLEEMVRVTERGCEPLSSYPFEACLLS